jgi:hypothetical protein
MKRKISVNKPIDIFILDNKQPTCCPKCGTRSDFEDIIHKGKIIQVLRCINTHCEFQFVGEFEYDDLTLHKSSPF